MEHRTVFITSFHPLISRNILASGLLELLSLRNIETVILAPSEKTDFFKEQFAGRGIYVEGVKNRLGWRDAFLRYLSLAVLDTASLRIKRITEMRGSGKFISRVLGNTFAGRSLVRAAGRVFIPARASKDLFDRYNPSAVFSTDVQNEFDVQLMLEAHSRGVPVIGMVRSWDNLTAKGLIPIVPDLLVVQNEIQAEDAVKLHGIGKERIRVIGIPHYDRYRKEECSDRESFFHSIGADPNRPLVLFAPVGDRYLSNNTIDRDVLHLLDQSLPSRYQILVRYPPDDQVYFLHGKYRQWEGRIFFDKPRGRLSRMGTNEELNRENDAHLRDTLFWSEIVICGPSTICIDAVFFDKPVVLVGFDGYERRPYFKSVCRYFDYNHWQSVLESGGVRLSRSADEFEAYIKKYLEDTTLDSSGRQRIVAEQCYLADGMSAERLAAILLSPEK